jgi:hypothetical protein
MRLFVLSLFAAARAVASPVSYLVTVDTSAISGTSGFLDFDFAPGNDSQSASVTIANFSSATSLTGVPQTNGGVSGFLPAGLTLTNSTQFNDYFQQFTYGPSVRFLLSFAGPALSSPDGNSTSGSTFAFAMFDRTGTNPLLTSDPYGNAFVVNVNLDGTTSASAFSNATLTAVPEPGAFLPLALALLGFAPALLGQAILNADGVTAAYARIQDVLHASPENPDCSHPAFGPHITQTLDNDLGKYAFVFNIHVTPDNDRCSAFDRQRLEIKTEGNASTPDYLKGFLNDTVTFRWKFKLPAGFQPSTSFTHIHQIKAYDGDSGSPLMTLTPRKGSPDFLELIHINSKGVTTHLTKTPLAPFPGEWVEGYEKITYSSNGQYSLVLSRLSDGAVLFSYANSDLDLWRTGTTVVRPKWGIYRSLDHPEQLRDEQVRYDRFCLAKGTDDCPSDQALPDFSIAANPAGPGQYAVDVTPLRGFNQNVSLNVQGLPAAASATFAPGTLNVATSGGTPPGSYTLVILGSSGILSHAATAALVIDGVPGDVNGDGAVNCADLNLVRAAFHAYNSRADFNGDGVVDIRDLAFASRQMPAGTTCE